MPVGTPWPPQETTPKRPEHTGSMAPVPRPQSWCPPGHPKNHTKAEGGVTPQSTQPNSTVLGEPPQRPKCSGWGAEDRSIQFFTGGGGEGDPSIHQAMVPCVGSAPLDNPSKDFPAARKRRVGAEGGSNQVKEGGDPSNH